MAYYEIFEKDAPKGSPALPIGKVSDDLAQHFGEPIKEMETSYVYQNVIALMFAGFMQANDWDNAKAVKKIVAWYKKEAPEDYDNVKELLNYFTSRYRMVAWRK